ncbi:Tyrosine kinase specific for activated [Ceratobasidium sp. AG-Ba]|nr:Tyrosine kinase specific for activated [Ceratobasidium sp. AG-Ba]
MTLTDSTQVAVKCLRQHDPKHIKRTARELSIWSKLAHGNILELQGLAVFQGCLAMVSPWMAYGSCLQLAHAVEFLHGENVVHGDIKGDNLVMDNNGVIKLMDFGLAIMSEAVFQFSQTDPGGGTGRWMAPELYGDDPQRSKETDIYAMGMTMLEIITGDVPFREIKAGHSVGMAVAHHRRIPRVPELEAETASGQDLLVHALLKWCWKYDPKERPTAGKVVSVIGSTTLLEIGRITLFAESGFPIPKSSPAAPWPLAAGTPPSRHDIYTPSASSYS